MDAQIQELVKRLTLLQRQVDGLIKPEVGAQLLFQTLPGLVGFWPLNTASRNTGNTFDLSGQAKTLTYNGNPQFNFYNGLVPYLAFDGVGDWLSRADEADFDILGNEAIIVAAARGLTMGAWVWLTNLGATEIIINKWNPTGNQQSYLLYKTGGNFVEMAISSTGANTFVATGATTISTGSWFFVVGRFTPSTEVAIFTNNNKVTNVTAIPATIFNSTANFLIGARGDLTLPITGRIALAFLSQEALSDALIFSLYEQSRVLFGV
jgi:hypothetical protein